MLTGSVIDGVSVEEFELVNGVEASSYRDDGARLGLISSFYTWHC